MPIWPLTSEYESRKGEQTVKDVVADADGNVYIAGYTTNSPDRKVVHGGGYDYFLTKFDSQGVYQWSRLTGVGHPGDQTAYGVDVDSAGSIYIVGHSDEALHGVEAENSPFIIKYDSAGGLLWVDVIETTYPGVAKDIGIDSSDNIYVVGDADLLLGQKNDGYIAKYLPDGFRQWQEVFHVLNEGRELNN